MKALLHKLVSALALAALGALWSTLVIVLAGPALLESLEPWAGRPLVYEQSVRVMVIATLALFMLVWSAYLLGQATLTRLCAFVAVLLGAISVAIICFIDLDETLGAEFSWIRYTTAIFLIAAAAVSAMIARGHRGAGMRSHGRLWVVLAVAFVGLAGDEILMFHEAFGTFIQNRFHATHLATDLVTIAYPLVALGLVLFLASKRAFLREYVVGHTAVVSMFAAAAIVFLVGQMGDTLDRWTHDKLVALGVSRSADPRLLFSDFWYPIWGPRQLMNNVEEVMENIAAALFFASFGLFWIEQRRPALRDRRLFANPTASRTLIAVIVIGFTGLSIWLARDRMMDSPAIGHQAKAIVGARDGLFHTDVVFFHPRWGLLLANEGGGNVIRYWNGAAQALPDPQGLVTDTDCVTATDNAVYVSSPSLHTIFKYTEASGWRAFATAENGLKEPEALVVVDSTMYVVDEEHHLVYVIDMTTKRVHEIKLTDPRWLTPEGITYHPGLGRLLITDDLRGTIATINFDETISLFADETQGLLNPADICVTSDGRIFVTDTGRRELIEFSDQGQVLNRIRFHPMYGYLVGVAVVEAQNPGELDRIYAVSSDGFFRISFMPSTLWELTLPPRAQ